MIHKSDLYYINQKTWTYNENLRILIYKTHDDRLGHAIKENCGTSINVSSPEEILGAPTGREGAGKSFEIDRLCMEEECGKMLVVPAKQRDC